MSDTPLILLTNDDGIESKGLTALHTALKQVADVIVVAPVTQQSATGQSITIFEPLHVFELQNDHTAIRYSVKGTPTDCVKIAIRSLLKRKPDIILSGINTGENTGYNIVYSGTVAAAREGAMLGICSAAISLTSATYNDFSVAVNFSVTIAQQLLERKLPAHTLLNINIPALPAHEISGIRITRQGFEPYREFYISDTDTNGSMCYWWTGEKHKNSHNDDPSFDTTAIKQNAISVTPLHYQQTNEQFIDTLRTWNIKY